MAMIYNLNYGPSGTRQWLQKKKHFRSEFLLRHSWNSAAFRAYVPFICRELGQPEAQTAEELQELFSKIKGLITFQKHGPLVKLMRWFSFFECHEWHSGEVWFTKLLMTNGGAPDEGLLETDMLNAEVEAGTLGHKEELRQLKMKMGGWALAPKLITPSTWWQNELLCSLVKPSWTCFSSRARSL